MYDEHDYIQQIIQEFGRALRKLLAEREERTYADFEKLIESTSWHCAHIAYPMVLEFSEGRLLEALRIAEDARPYRYTVLGDLLSLDGAALEKEGRTWDAVHRRRRALMLYAAGVRVAERSELWDLRMKVEGLIEVIGDPCLTDDAKRMFDEFWPERAAYYGLILEALPAVQGTEETLEFSAT